MEESTEKSLKQLIADKFGSTPEERQEEVNRRLSKQRRYMEKKQKTKEDGEAIIAKIWKSMSKKQKVEVIQNVLLQKQAYYSYLLQQCESGNMLDKDKWQKAYRTQLDNYIEMGEKLKDYSELDEYRIQNWLGD